METTGVSSFDNFRALLGNGIREGLCNRAEVGCIVGDFFAVNVRLSSCSLIGCTKD